MRINHAQVATQILKLSSNQCFSEHICWLMFGNNMKHMHESRQKSFAYNLTVNFNALCAFVKYRIFSHVNGSLIVTQQFHRLGSKMPNEAKNVFSRTSSLVIVAIDRYSASADDLETVDCFLVFQETGEPP